MKAWWNRLDPFMTGFSHGWYLLSYWLYVHIYIYISIIYDYITIYVYCIYIIWLYISHTFNIQYHVVYKNGKPLSWMALSRDPKTARSFSFAQTSPRVNQPWRHRAGNHGILSLKMGQFPAFFRWNILDDLLSLWKKPCFFELFGWLPLIVVPGCCRYEFKPG